VQKDLFGLLGSLLVTLIEGLRLSRFIRWDLATIGKVNLVLGVWYPGRFRIDPERRGMRSLVGQNYTFSETGELFGWRKGGSQSASGPTPSSLLFQCEVALKQ